MTDNKSHRSSQPSRHRCSACLPRFRPPPAGARAADAGTAGGLRSAGSRQRASLRPQRFEQLCPAGPGADDAGAGWRSTRPGLPEPTLLNLNTAARWRWHASLPDWTLAQASVAGGTARAQATVRSTTARAGTRSRPARPAAPCRHQPLFSAVRTAAARRHDIPQQDALVAQRHPRFKRAVVRRKSGGSLAPGRGPAMQRLRPGMDPCHKAVYFWNLTCCCQPC